MTVGPSPAFGDRVARVLADLRIDTAAPQRRLAQAVTARDQAAAARRLAHAYGDAAGVLDDLPDRVVDGIAIAGLSSGLSEAAGAYDQLAAAAGAGRQADYDRAKDALGAARGAIRTRPADAGPRGLRDAVTGMRSTAIAAIVALLGFGAAFAAGRSSRDDGTARAAAAASRPSALAVPAEVHAGRHPAARGRAGPRRARPGGVPAPRPAPPAPRRVAPRPRPAPAPLVRPAPARPATPPPTTTPKATPTPAPQPQKKTTPASGAKPPPTITIIGGG